MHNSQAAVRRPARSAQSGAATPLRDRQQQKNAACLGMWLFLAQEIMFFGGMFCAYLVYRYKHFEDFGSASQPLNIWLGAINTGVLLCSSLTVVLAVNAAQPASAKRWSC